MDHVPPLAITYEIGVEQASERSGGLWLVPACKECNSTLGNLPFYTISSRARRILKRYKTKYRKILNYPKWEPEEYEEMDYSLRQPIEAIATHQKIVRDRLARLQSNIVE